MFSVTQSDQVLSIQTVKFSKIHQNQIVSYEERNKACQRCILCRSLSFCPQCSKCPQCCKQSHSGRSLTEVWASFGKLHAPLQNETPSCKVTSGSEWLCKPGQEPVSKRGINHSDTKVSSRESGCPLITSLLQPVVLSTQTKSKVETDFGSKPIKSVSLPGNFQNGNTQNNQTVPTTRGVGDLTGLQRCLLPYPHSTKVEKVFEVLPKQSNFPVHCPPFRVGHSSPIVYKGGRGGKTHSTSQGYPDPPVPRRLVTESPLPTTYPDPLGPLPTIRVGSTHEEIRIDTTAGLRFHRLPVRSGDRSGPTHSGQVGNPSREVKN